MQQESFCIAHVSAGLDVYLKESSRSTAYVMAW